MWNFQESGGKTPMEIRCAPADSWNFQLPMST